MSKGKIASIAIFIVGLGLLILEGQQTFGDSGQSVGATALALCSLAIWNVLRLSDEVEQRFALNAFALGFAAMAGWSYALDAYEWSSIFTVWNVGFGVWLITYAGQKARALW